LGDARLVGVVEAVLELKDQRLVRLLVVLLVVLDEPVDACAVLPAEFDPLNTGAVIGKPISSGSSSMMVPIPCASARIAPPVGALSVKKSVSSFSSTLSTTTGKATVCAVCPGEKVSMPLRME